MTDYSKEWQAMRGRPMNEQDIKLECLRIAERLHGRVGPLPPSDPNPEHPIDLAKKLYTWVTESATKDSR